MQSYKRKITYFYQYHNGTVGTTAGFLKLEIRGDKVKIIINIQEPPGLPYREASLYFYHEAGDHLAAVKVDTVERKDGVLAYMSRTDWQQLFDTGRDLYTFDGVAVMYNENHYYIGDFADKDRRDFPLVIKEKRVKPDILKIIAQPDVQSEMETDPPFSNKESNQQESNRYEDNQREHGQQEETQQEDTRYEDNQQEYRQQEETQRENTRYEDNQSEYRQQQRTRQKVNSQDNNLQEHNQPEHMQSEPLYDKCENCPYHKKQKEKNEQVDSFEKMIEEYPKLPMYGATELFDCVRIHPKDIGKLDMRNWKLGVNSFLTHGFYTYQYLLLGKMWFGDGTAHRIIGVPGVFSNREKYLANMFGFEQFIPVKKTGVKTGEFGYWIVEISPYL